jgi:pilus assembly protein CpaE
MPPLAPLGPRLLRSELGQASVELVAVVPLVLLCAAIAWQLALAGQTAWLCANAARVAARAEAVGRNPRAAARSAVPQQLRHGLQVSRVDGGAIRVRLRMPFLLKSWPTPIVVSASAGLPKGGP